jgi:hypothetical protein
MGPENKGKPQFIENDADGEYIKNRLARFIRFFDREREKNRTRERQLQYAIIGLGALIPVINVIGPKTLESNILSAIFGGSIALFTAILQFEKYHERWLSSKKTATKLSNEYFRWKNCSGVYGSDYKNDLKIQGEMTQKEQEEKLALLVERCEDIIASEAFDYVTLFSPSYQSKPPDKKDPSNPIGQSN